MIVESAACQPGRAAKVSGRVNDLDGQRMQPLVNKILQCIIHKAVARNAALAIKQRRSHTNAKVRAGTLRIGARMAGVRSTFVNHLQGRGLQYGLQSRLNGRDSRQSGRCTHAAPSLSVMYLLR